MDAQHLCDLGGELADRGADSRTADTFTLRLGLSLAIAGQLAAARHAASRVKRSMS